MKTGYMKIGMRILLCVSMVHLLLPLHARLHPGDGSQQEFFQLKEPTVEDYVNLIYRGSRQNKLYAIKKLMESGSRDKRVIDALLFGLQQGTRIVERRYERVVNDFFDVRCMSAEALGKTGDPGVLPDLYLTLKYDPDTNVRSSVALAIGKIGGEESIRHLKQAITASSRTGPDDMLILSCVEAIGNIGGREGRLSLIEIIRGSYREHIKRAAQNALKKIQKKTQ